MNSNRYFVNFSVMFFSKSFFDKTRISPTSKTTSIYVCTGYGRLKISTQSFFILFILTLPVQGSIARRRFLFHSFPNWWDTAEIQYFLQGIFHKFSLKPKQIINLQKNWVFAANSNFLFPLSLQPNIVNL